MRIRIGQLKRPFLRWLATSPEGGQALLTCEAPCAPILGATAVQRDRHGPSLSS
jgi:hypothetical protein